MEFSVARWIEKRDWTGDKSEKKNLEDINDEVNIVIYLLWLV